jgi:uncharacterized protein involved in tellurium resistance
MAELDHTIDTDTMFSILGSASRKHSDAASKATERTDSIENLRCAIALQDAAQSIVKALGGEYEDYQEVYTTYFM